MKRLLIWGLLVAVCWLLWRKVAAEAAPAIREKCVAKCDQMLAKMPESFPPNRIMADLDHLKEQTARILDALHDARSGGPATA